LAIRDGREVVFVAKAAGRSAVFQAIQLGARLPAHATALGRVLLADLDAGALKTLFAGKPLTGYTPATPTTVAALQMAVLADQARGYAVSESGFEAGISTIAAPILNAQRLVCAAISITIPASRIDPVALSGLVAQVRSAAQALTQRMGHLPQPSYKKQR
jgi:DNA-binding IclR family transcriptional regulator